MKFSTVVEQVLELLQRQKRVSYRALKREFDLDDEYIEDLKTELITAKQLARDEDGIVLVWTGDASVASSQLPVASSQPPAPSTHPPDVRLRTPNSELIAAERRQLTVMFCDLVGSTALSALLDPEELRDVVRAYHETCAAVISRYAGHTAQHLGDGLLVYFGYPAAHEDDAQRAVRTGLEILAELPQLNRQLQPTVGATHASPLQLRIGLHTGLVVVGEIGGGGKRENLALGETPNIAARVQGEAEPNTVVLSAATYRLVQGLFECQDLGPHTLKGISTPLPLYRVVRESEIRSRFEVAVSTGLTPLVGREQEVGLLWDRWERTQEGAGQVVLLSGEAGIGKSRLVQVLKERIATEQHTRLECRCSPYHQNSALYPVIDLLQRVLQFSREDTLEEKRRKLEELLERRGGSQTRPYSAPQEVVPLFASLLSLPLPERHPPLTLTPQKQKEKTQHAIVTWLLKAAERQSLLLVWEDLHWADPSTLELLDLLIVQAPTARMYLLLTFRPEFTPPWASRSHLTSLTLNRLPHTQAEGMVRQVTGGKALPPEVLQQIVTKTDGVPLFVEELTKMVVESGLLREEDDRYVGAHGRAPLPLGIPATLHDALMARLDRLGPSKAVAQLGATLGREFSYELLQAVSSIFSWDEATLQRQLARLVDAEFLFQRGLPPQARYVFKHALIQDTAYQSLLKSKRQQLHQQIAHVLGERFPETKETQPELLAHHYTEGGLIAQAIPCRQEAGQRAVQRSANVEAVRHLSSALELLATLPETLARAQQELDLQIALGPALSTAKGVAAPEVEQTYARARALCAQVGETPQLFPTLLGLYGFYLNRGALPTARELGEQLLRLAERTADPTHRLYARETLGLTLFFLGDYATARTHVEQGIALIDPTVERTLALRHGGAPGVRCLGVTANTLWCLGYPGQAVRRSQEALTLAQDLTHPYSLVMAQFYAAWLHYRRREVPAVQAWADALLTLASAQGFPLLVGLGTCWRGWALAMQGEGEAGLAQLRQGLAAVLATGEKLQRPLCLVLLAEAAGHDGQVEEGLRLLAEALTVLEANGLGDVLAEAYRLKGTLTLQSQGSPRQVSGKSQASQDEPEVKKEAETCFYKAIEIARKQQAKSLELRAVTSLARLWQQQGKQHEARKTLSEVYNWFTEGFDTKDLQEAKALLEELT